MIHGMILTHMNERRQVKAPKYKADMWGFYIKPYEIEKPAEFVNTWKALQDKLSSTEDYVIWTYNKNQADDFLEMLKKYDLNKYIIHQSVMVTNPNYRERRVATMIMKGIPNEQSAQTDAGL